MSSTACWTEPGGFPFPRNPDKSTASRRDRPEPSAPSFSFAARPAKVTESHDVKYFAGKTGRTPRPASGFTKVSRPSAAGCPNSRERRFIPCKGRRHAGFGGIASFLHVAAGPWCSVKSHGIPAFFQVGAGEKFLSEQAVRVAVFGKSVYNRINTAIRRGEAWACSNSSVVQAGSPLP